MDDKELSALTGELGRALSRRNASLAVYRDYYRGRFRTPYLPAYAQAEFTAMMDRAKANWCRKVIDVTARRLRVVGVKSSVLDEDALWGFWQASRMDRKQAMVHRAATRYGIAYVTVGMGRMTSDGSVTDPDVPSLQPASPLQLIHLEDPADTDTVTAAMRQWKGSDDRTYTYVWTPDEWVLSTGAPFGRKTVIADGENPLGVVPVVPFKNAPDDDGSVISDLEIAVPIQDRINQTIADRLLVQTYGAHRQRVLLGLELEVDDEGQPKRVPNPSTTRTWVFEDENIKVEEFAETDLGPFLAAAEADIKHLASLTDTPPQDLLGEMVNISAEALKAAMKANTAKVADRQATFGEDWEQALNLASAMAGGGQDSGLEVVWEDTEPRSESEFMDALSKKAALGVPVPTLFAEMGYSPQEIDMLLAQRDAALAAEARVAAAALGVDTATTATGGGSEVKAQADALGVLIRSGVDPQDAAARVGLSGLDFTGATPVALRPPGE